MTDKQRAAPELWRKRMAEQRKSGDSGAAYCRERGIARRRFSRGFDAAALRQLIAVLGAMACSACRLCARWTAASTRLWRTTEPTDMRRGFDRLAEMARR